MVGSCGSFAPKLEFWVSGRKQINLNLHLITNAAALRLGHFLLRQNFMPLKIAPRLNEHHFKLPHHASLFYFGGGEGDVTPNSADQQQPGPVNNNRRLTNILLALNVLVYAAQVASQGQVIMWGAKINGLIGKGQLWRLLTSAFLHANVGHLMINCYSLNSIGPTMEHLSGPRRYLVIYITSAVASSTMSYWFSKAPAVGASGAIFGLVGSFAIFVLRHNKMVKGGVGDLNHVARVIALNMAIGLLSQGIDNWGHLGGLLGGIATSWLIGPAWELKSTSRLGRKVLIDKAPIFSLSGRKPKQASE